MMYRRLVIVFDVDADSSSAIANTSHTGFCNVIFPEETFNGFGFRQAFDDHSVRWHDAIKGKSRVVVV